MQCTLLVLRKLLDHVLIVTIQFPPAFETRLTVDPRFNRMKCLNDNDKEIIKMRLITAMTANLAFN